MVLYALFSKCQQFFSEIFDFFSTSKEDPDLRPHNCLLYHIFTSPVNTALRGRNKCAPVADAPPRIRCPGPLIPGTAGGSSPFEKGELGEALRGSKRQAVNGGML